MIRTNGRLCLATAGITEIHGESLISGTAYTGMSQPMTTTAIAAAMQNVPIPNTASALRGWARNPSSSATPPAMAAMGTAQSSDRVGDAQRGDLLDREDDVGQRCGAFVADDLDQLLSGDLHLLGPRTDQAGV